MTKSTITTQPTWTNTAHTALNNCLDALELGCNLIITSPILCFVASCSVLGAVANCCSGSDCCPED